MDSWLDNFPSRERERILRLKQRSPEEYEKLREKVKGQPREIAREAVKNAEMAELSFSLETEPKLKEHAKQRISEHISSLGPGNVIDAKISQSSFEQIKQGKFELVVTARERTPRLSLKVSKAQDAPSSNVQEILPLKLSYQNKFISTFKLN